MMDTDKTIGTLSNLQRWMLAGFLLIGIPVLVSVFNYLDLDGTPSAYTWNQTLTLEVVKDGETFVGSSTITVTWNENDFKLNDPTWLPEIEGQAPYIQMEDGSIIFALLGTERFHDLAAMWLFEDKVTADPTDEMLELASEITGETIEIGEEFFPYVVVFTDPRDPRSVSAVNSGENGVTEIRFFVTATTDEPTPIYAAELLPWMNLSREQLLAIGEGSHPAFFYSLEGDRNIASSRDIYRSYE